ncbi:hypothetical protein niasHT_023058 [Heterodera trifolii]|uniref:BTB domain-containing protein n=1 Tax=Heterodera trifolii TaxID=157864 RepID=A0ABD2KF19_9BILA
MMKAFILTFINICLIASLSSTPCPLFGTLQLELNNFLEYANEPVGSLRRGNAVNIRGMSWQLGAELTESAAEDGTKYLGLNLYCNNNCKIDANWNCFSMLEFRITVGQLLAAHSSSFNDFFANFQPPAESTSSTGGLSVTLDAPSTVEHFEQLMDLLHNGDCVLEDENLENVLRLAQHFHLHDIEFILYNLLQQSDFVAQNFLQNLEIIEQLSDGAKIALKQRIKELFEAAQ